MLTSMQLDNFNIARTTSVVDINNLNTTLLNLKYQLDSTANLNLVRANISVEEADQATAEGFIVTNNTIEAARQANSILWGVCWKCYQIHYNTLN